MNKYDKKILEIAQEGGTIHELIRRPVRSPLIQFIDMMLNNTLWTVDGLREKGAFYLLLDETKADLVHIERNFNVSHQDVTSVIQSSAHKSSFKFEGSKYKLYRKIK